MPGDLRTTWLIARRGAVESLRDRLTLAISAVYALVLPSAIALLIVRPQADQIGADASGALGTGIAIYFLLVGLLPASGSVGVASGLFAGEKEQGNLLPLLATPASNRAIFAGKVLGAVLPSLLYCGIAEATFLAATSSLLGAGVLRLLPLALSLAMFALVPAEALLGAAVACLVSSRVRTYQSAQMLTSLALYPIMGALLGLAAQMPRWGWPALLGMVAVVIALDALLVVVGAATWRREELLARR